MYDPIRRTYEDMPALKYKVELNESERTHLKEIASRGETSARKVKRALVLLKADEGLIDRDIASGLLISTSTVGRVRTRFVKEGLDSALNERTRPGQKRKLDGRQEAHLIAVACSDAPEGHTDWTLQLLADKAVAMGFAESISLETVRQILKKNELKPWKKKEWCIPEVSGEFVARMEDVLDLYHQDYDPDHPVVCFDETSKQLVADKRPSIGARPGRVERYDYEYKRNGTRNLFMFCEPKAGWRHVEVTERRTAVDFAHQMRWLVDEAYPHTETIRLVLDNLNTHKLGSLYDAFEPAEARRIAKRLEFHYTPLHGSWLNMAEIELSVLSNQCLNRRISDEVVLKREVLALERERNEAVAIIDWRFSTQDARTKLQHIYPSYSD